VVVGSQWGDEGKGRVVDLLAAEADLVVRFQGGNNAGHTVWVGEQRFAFHLIPTGILRGKLSVLGAGMVVDLEVLLEEETRLADAGVAVRGNLRISENAHLILPYHKALEKAEEERLGSRAIGTTRRGIGPAYEDKVARRGIRVGDLRDADSLAEVLSEVTKYKNLVLQKVYGQPPVDAIKLFNDLRVLYAHYAEDICDCSALVSGALAAGKRVLFEGAHGTMLDIDWGTYPFVTSSNPTAGAVSSGIGIAPRRVGCVIGVAKAYTTRVGHGPFPTEVEEKLAASVREAGGEFGTTTGRARRIGWFDAVVVRKSARLNGLDSLAIGHLDVLGQFDEIPVCRAYSCEGEETLDFPNHLRDLARCQPVYTSLPGWKSDISAARRFGDLPANAQRYVKAIEELVGVQVSHVLVGRQRGQDIVV
jgi:adenylosuccinate synthase